MRHGKNPLLQVMQQSGFPLISTFSPDLSVISQTCSCCLLLFLFIAAYSDKPMQGRNPPFSKGTFSPFGKKEAFEVETGSVGAEFKALLNG